MIACDDSNPAFSKLILLQIYSLVWAFRTQLFCVTAYLLFACAAVTIGTFRPAFAATTEICDRAAQRAAAETGVPLSVLWSITRTETGRAVRGDLRPWPWTVNVSGKGHWFDTEAAARDFAIRNFNSGMRSFDVGCFQINYKWHGAAFQSIDQMFEPLANARYAAAFLLRLYRETGDWSTAAGAYHSRTPEFANRYRAKFDRIRKSHAHTPVTQTGITADRPNSDLIKSKPRQNRYPLLTHAGSSISNGSLVPLQQGRARALFTIPGSLEGS